MSAIPKLELRSITKYQKELHTSKANSHGVEEIDSLFHQEFKRITLYTKILQKLRRESTGEDNDQYTFEANKTFHKIKSSYQVQYWPHIFVKPKYRGKYQIAWPYNGHSNTISCAKFVVGDVKINQFDRVWLDETFEFLMKCGHGFRKQHHKCMRNLPHLIEWQDELKPGKSELHQPWFYSYHPSFSFPLYYCGNSSDAKHIYDMNNKIKNLLRMRKLVRDGRGNLKWVEMDEVDFKVLNIKEKARLRNPEMWAEYSYMTDNEVDYEKDCGEEEDFVLHINDVVMCDQTNSSGYGETAMVELESKYPCKAIFWVAENETASKRRNYSNYTTDSENLFTGSNPIKKVTMKYGEADKFKDYESHHFSRMQSLYHFPSAPSTEGHNAYAISENPLSIDAEAGLTFSDKLKSKMFFDLEDPATLSEPLPSQSSDDEEEIIEDDYTHESETISHRPLTKFKARARLLVLKKLTIRKKIDNSYEFII